MENLILEKSHKLRSLITTWIGCARASFSCLARLNIKRGKVS